MMITCVLQAQIHTETLAREFRREELIRQVDATYPVAAQAARVRGVVILEAVVNEKGVVDTLRLVSGHPLLVNAAFEAAKQCLYLPATVNGVPARATTFIWITFPTGSIVSPLTRSTRQRTGNSNHAEKQHRFDLRLFEGLWQGGEVGRMGINTSRGSPIPLKWSIEFEGERLVRTEASVRSSWSRTVSYELDGSETRSDGSTFPLQFAGSTDGTKYQLSRRIKTLSRDLIELEDRLFALPGGQATGSDAYAIIDESWELSADGNLLEAIQNYRTIASGVLGRYSMTYDFKRNVSSSGR